METKLRIVSDERGVGPYRLVFNDWTRTVVDNFFVENRGYEDYTFDPNYEYSLCSNPHETIGGRLYIRLEDDSCIFAQNPEVNLQGYENTVQTIFEIPDAGMLEPIDELWSNGEELVFSLKTSLFEDPSLEPICATLPTVPDIDDEPIFAKLPDNSFLMFDPRLDLMENTPASPVPDGGKNAVIASGGDTYCANVPRNFLNEEYCKVANDACKPSVNKAINIVLGNETISVLNHLTDRYVYAVVGQLVKYEGINLQHPCTPGLRSRWEPVPIDECDPTDLYGNTNTSIYELLLKSGDRNPYIRDIFFPNEGGNCSVADTETEIEIEVDGECWRRVHDEYMSVFDVSNFNGFSFHWAL